MNISKTIARLSLLTTMAATMLCSCSREPDISKKETPRVRKEGSTTIVETIETPTQFVLGATSAPENFPSDLPLYPGSEPNVSFTKDDTIFVTFFTKEKKEEVKEFFLGGKLLEKQGWKLGDIKDKGSGIEINMQKNGRRAIISLTTNTAKSGTDISYVANLE